MMRRIVCGHLIRTLVVHAISTSRVCLRGMNAFCLLSSLDNSQFRDDLAPALGERGSVIGLRSSSHCRRGRWTRRAMLSSVRLCDLDHRFRIMQLSTDR